jgi:hypothetical protein
MEIRNKVKESSLIQMDLTSFKPKCEMLSIDLSKQLWKGLVLKEKEFRSWIKEECWTAYKDKGVYIFCSTEAIIPTWAFMLVTSCLSDICELSVVGSKADLERALIAQNIAKLELQDFSEQRVIIKGCSDIADPAFAMSELVKKLQPIVKSIMYGEPCSTVPIFKRKRLNS